MRVSPIRSNRLTMAAQYESSFVPLPEACTPRAAVRKVASACGSVVQSDCWAVELLVEHLNQPNAQRPKVIAQDASQRVGIDAEVAVNQPVAQRDDQARWDMGHGTSAAIVRTSTGT